MVKLSKKTVDNLNFSLDDLDVHGTERFTLEELLRYGLKLIKGYANLLMQTDSYEELRQKTGNFVPQKVLTTCSSLAGKLCSHLQTNLTGPVEPNTDVTMLYESIKVLEPMFHDTCDFLEFR
jgi:hypothetical protein